MIVQYRPSLYTAGKLFRAEYFRLLRSNHPEFEFTARWIDQPRLDDNETNASPAEFAHFWTMDIQDATRSDFTLCYGGDFNEPSDELKGALVEAGTALGAGKIVLAVNLPTRHTWSWHPRVVRFLNTQEAFDFLQRYVRRPL